MSDRIERPNEFTKSWAGPQDPPGQDETPETEGHFIKDPEVEGHGVRFIAAEQGKEAEVKGHGVTPPPSAMQQEESEVEGHMVNIRRPIIRD